MNRYPAWKYILIAVALVVGIFYTLPNFFPEVPAVQVSTSKASVKIDAGTLQTVEDALKSANVSYSGALLDSTGVKVRLPDPDTQLKARDVLQQKFGDNYIVALNLLSTSPRWLASIGALPMYLGLDLRGGVHFLLQVDMKAALDKAADRYLTDIRSLLREKKVLYSGIAREGQNVGVRFRDSTERNKAYNEIASAFPDLQLNNVDGGSDFKLVAGLKPEAQKRIQEGAVQQNITILRNRVNELGVAEPIVQQQGADRVVVQLPGVQDTTRAKDIIGRTASLEIRMVDDDPAAQQMALSGQVPLGDDRLTEPSGAPILVKRQVVLTGDRISDAQPGFDGRTNEPAVHVNLDGAGARIFKELTRENVNKRMAILLVEKGKAEVITAPVIREEIGGGRVQISGRMNTRRSQRHRALDARGRPGRADGNRRGAHRRPVARQGQHRKGIRFCSLRLCRPRRVHLRVLHADGDHFDDFAGSEPAAADLDPVDVAGDAYAAGYRRRGIDARHGDRRQCPDQRAHTRGAALGRHASRGDTGRLRAGVEYDSRLERDDADSRPGIAYLRQRSGARLRGGALPRDHDVDVQRRVRLARTGRARLRRP